MISTPGYNCIDLQLKINRISKLGPDLLSVIVRKCFQRDCHLQPHVMHKISVDKVVLVPVKTHNTPADDS